MILAIDQSYSGTGVAYIASDGVFRPIVSRLHRVFPGKKRWDTIIEALNGYNVQAVNNRCMVVKYERKFVSAL